MSRAHARCHIDMRFLSSPAGAIILFSAASASLLLINKACLVLFHAPSFISTLQFVSASVTPLCLMLSGAVPVDAFEWTRVRPYLTYVGLFVVTIYCNMKALEHSNVETVIVFRACCPLAVCVLDWAFMGRQLPSARSALSLLLLTAGASGYVLSDRQFRLEGADAYRCAVGSDWTRLKYRPPAQAARRYGHEGGRAQTRTPSRPGAFTRARH